MIFLVQGEKVNYEKFKSWILQNKDAFTFSRWLLSSGVCVTLTDDSDTPTFYQTLAGVTHCKSSRLKSLFSKCVCVWALETSM